MAKAPTHVIAWQQHKQRLKQQELHFERRFDTVIAQLQQERAVASAMRARLQEARAHQEAIFAETKVLYERAVVECERLRSVLTIKHEIIQRLLPFYPHPITPELQHQIDLT